MPLYIALSYLLAHFSLLLISSLIERHSASLRSKRIAQLKYSTDSIDFMMENRTINIKPKYEPENHYLNYIKNLFRGCHLYSNGRFPETSRHNPPPHLLLTLPRTNSAKKLSAYLMRQKSHLIEKTSFFLHLCETYVYRVVPHMKYSKQFLNTYTVSFMIVYFFTLYGLKLADYLSDRIAYFLKFLLKLVFNQSIQDFRINEQNSFKSEFKVTVVLTSLGIIVQLLLGIRKFHNDLIKLNKGASFFTLLLFKHKKHTYSMKARKRDKAISSIISNSLHFPGYLVAHLVYGYILLFLSLFAFIVFLKFLCFFPRISTGLAQLGLPFVIVIFLKYFLIEWFMPRFIFLRNQKNNIDLAAAEKTKRNKRSNSTQSVYSFMASKKVYKLNSYYIVSYFNFFLDCFLGLTSCMSRVWLNNLVSVVTLARIDISMFNQENNLLIKRLDKAYLAYISYVRMEHFYNNPVVNGFCDLVVDLMIISKKEKENLKHIEFKKAIIEANYDRITFLTSSNLSRQTVFLHEDNQNLSLSTTNINCFNPNETFKYESLLKLRNLMFLALLLRRNPILAKVRFKNLRRINQPTGKAENLHEAIKRIYKNYLKKESS